MRLATLKITGMSNWIWMPTPEFTRKNNATTAQQFGEMQDGHNENVGKMLETRAHLSTLD